MVIYPPPRLCSTHSAAAAASVRPEQKQMAQSCQLCVRVHVCECVFHGSLLGCGSLSSPAAAVTRYSTHTFLLLIQACLCAMILVHFNLL